MTIKWLDAIMRPPQDTGMRVVSPLRVQVKTLPYPFGMERLSQTHGYEFTFSYSTRRFLDPQHLHEAMKQERRRIADLVYDDIRAKLHEAERVALDNGDIEVLALLQEAVEMTRP